MIPIEEVKELKPGAVLYRVKQVAKGAEILATSPITRINSQTVIFEKDDISTFCKSSLSHQSVASNYCSEEKDAFLTAIAYSRETIKIYETCLTEAKSELQASEEAARKKGWL